MIPKRRSVDLDPVRTFVPRRAWCATCLKEISGVELTQYTYSAAEWECRATCHGATEVVSVASEAVYGAPLSLTFFRRNWAEYRRPTVRELLEKMAKGSP
jgi:hypothetical protein